MNITEEIEGKFANVRENKLAHAELVEYFNFYSSVCFEYVADIIAKSPTKTPQEVIFKESTLTKGFSITRQNYHIRSRRNIDSQQ